MAMKDRTGKTVTPQRAREAAHVLGKKWGFPHYGTKYHLWDQGTSFCGLFGKHYPVDVNLSHEDPWANGELCQLCQRVAINKAIDERLME